MKTTLYYFTGSGNSLAIAKRLAEQLGAETRHVADFEEQDEVRPESDIVGIIFPVYYIGLMCIPLIVSRFISKLKGMDSKYFFAVYTPGGGSLDTKKRLLALCRKNNLNLSAGFELKMPQNSFYKAYEKKDRVLRKAKKKMEFIADYVARAKAGRYESSPFYINILLYPLIPYIRKTGYRDFRKLARVSVDSDLPFEELVTLSDRSFRVNEHCNGCATCVKLCPAGNIRLLNGKPEWQGHCETCLACYHWCPQSAIEGGIMRDAEGYYYRHPEVKLSDMLRR